MKLCRSCGTHLPTATYAKSLDIKLLAGAKWWVSVQLSLSRLCLLSFFFSLQPLNGLSWPCVPGLLRHDLLALHQPQPKSLLLDFVGNRRHLNGAGSKTGKRSKKKWHPMGMQTVETYLELKQEVKKCDCINCLGTISLYICIL